MPTLRRSGERGAALILEIIIYLVIVALIAVAVTSGLRALRDLVFAAHARSDIQNFQQWMEGQYSQTGKYPGNNVKTPIEDMPGSPELTTSFGGVRNHGSVIVQNGANSGYCMIVWSAAMSRDGASDAKSRFWLSSANPHKIMQQSTGSNPNGSGLPDSGIPGVVCPI